MDAAVRRRCEDRPTHGNSVPADGRCADARPADAVWAVEPFFTILRKSGNVRVIGYPYQENIPNMDVTAMFAKESWLKANSDAAKRFRAVFARAQKFMPE